MKNDSAQTILQHIQPQCDTLYKKMKKEKKKQGKTNNGIAERTGVPLSTVAKFFSGAISTPCIFNMAAIAIDLGMSLDELMGIVPEAPNEEMQRQIEQLTQELESVNKELEVTQELNNQLKKGIAERRPIIYGITALCIFLAVTLVGYVKIDIRDPAFGFFKENYALKLIAVSIIIVSTIGLIVWHVAKKRFSVKDEEK